MSSLTPAPLSTVDRHCTAALLAHNDKLGFQDVREHGKTHLALCLELFCLQFHRFDALLKTLARLGSSMGIVANYFGLGPGRVHGAPRVIASP